MKTTGRYTGVLGTGGFGCYLGSQFLTAFNDNLFKVFLSLAAVNLAAGAEGASGYVSLVGGVFIVPFLLFSGYAGALADSVNKRTVFVTVKVFEVAAAAFAAVSLAWGYFPLMLASLFLLALQSAVLSPAKYGILPEMVPYRELSMANGLVETSTFVAIIGGTAAGSFAYWAWSGEMAWAGLVLVASAAAGAWLARGIGPVAGPAKKEKAGRASALPWAEIKKGAVVMARDRVLGLAAAGVAWFWFLGALFQMVILLFGRKTMSASDLETGLMVTFLAAGIGAGSLAAGRLSGEKIEPGLVPLGALGIGVFTTVLSFSAHSYPLASTMLFLAGFSGGLFIVPLNAIVQRRSPGGERGRVIGTGNFMNMTGVLAASVALWTGGDLLSLTPGSLVLAIGLGGLATFTVSSAILARFLARFVLWCLVHAFYDIRIRGRENRPLTGPALIVSNHLSFFDGPLLGSTLQRSIRFLVAERFFRVGPLGRFLTFFGAVPLSDESPREMIRGLERIRAELEAGHVVCVFAEGTISRTGQILGFKKGFQRVTKGLDVPVIPVHLDGVWGSVASFKGGRFFTKLPERLRRRVTVSWGEPLPAGTPADVVRRKVTELGCDSVIENIGPGDTLARRFIKSAKRRPFSRCVADSTGAELTRWKALAGALVLRKRLDKLAEGENVGVLLPASAGGALANVALTMAGRVPVNLNFTAGPAQAAKAARGAGMRTVVTSRAFVEKAGLAELASALEAGGVRPVWLEDVREAATGAERASCGAAALAVPGRILSRLYGGATDPSAPATIVFTSGTTGEPRGVVLSHRNVLGNIEGFRRVFHLTRRDTLLGVLPLFHSFGFTATVWYPLTEGFPAVYHTNPLDASTVGRLARTHSATVLIGSPAFLSAYTRKCDPGDFRTFKHVIAGAEKLRPAVAKDFHEKFGIAILEGYGCTEMGPVVSVNVPDVTGGPAPQKGNVPGTVGRPIPGVAARVVDPETGGELPAGAEGMLMVRGPGLMAGYLGDPEATGRVVRAAGT